MRATILLALVLASGPANADDVMDGWSRRGAVYASIAMDDGTPASCAALCSRDGNCRSWVWTIAGLDGPDTQCALLSAAPTPFRSPGRVTGLSAGLVQRIEAAAERPPSPRELNALQSMQHGEHD
ncbi:PAN domain-containing protein [Maricaulis sp.]|uniref:PAN domain-containing protein n=1 Tax=Maricaulis sp. TaxID=1486257 RepID=UPI003296D324